MKLQHRNDGWWIVEVPNCEDCGPYESKSDAEKDRWGMERFFKFQDRPDFMMAEVQE